MAIHGEWIHFGDDCQYTGYLARPGQNSEPLPSVLILQEIWGVDRHIEDVTRRFAGAGYVAFAPDLYAERGERPKELAPNRIAEVQNFVNENGFAVIKNQTACKAALATKPEDLRCRLEETMKHLFSELTSGGLRLDKYLPLCLESTRFLREKCNYCIGQKVASVGYCMGGGLSALLACNDPWLSGAVIYYGSAPNKQQISNIQCPVLGLYAEFDEHINTGILPFSAVMNELGKRFEYTIYPKAQHAFFNDGRPSYCPNTSRDAFLKTLGFLKQNL